MKRILLLSILTLSLLGGFAIAKDKAKEKSAKGINLNYNPNFNLSGIKLNTDDLESLAYEKCESSTTATIDSDYFLTDKLFIFNTESGYGVASIDLSYKDLETGRRRQAIPKNQQKASCKVMPGMQIKGEFDCVANIKLAKKVPYDHCAYDLKVFGHSMSKEEAFQLVYKKLQIQFLDYRDQCKITPKTTIQDRMLKF